MTEESEEEGDRKNTDHIGSDDDLVRQGLVERPLEPLNGTNGPERTQVILDRPEGPD